MQTKPTVWTGNKTLGATTHMEFGTFFWLLIIILVVAFIAWRAGWFPAIKSAASRTFSQENLEAMLNR